jgi:suppressor for copper-sensitivity B
MSRRAIIQQVMQRFIPTQIASLGRLVRDYTRILPVFGAVLFWVLGGIGTAVSAGERDVAGKGAGASNWVGDPEFGEARLVSAVSATGDLSVLPLGLEFTLAPGWKIYWRTPGEAGLAPVLDLSPSPQNLASKDGAKLSGEFRWVLPKRFDAFGFDNFGYANQVILPFDIRGHDIGESLAITADMEALVCAEICVPLAGRLSLTLPAGEAAPSPYARTIAQFAAMVPRLADTNGISASAPSLPVVEVIETDGGLLVTLGGDAPAITPKIAPKIDDIFVEGIDGVTFKGPVKTDTGQLFLAAAPASLGDAVSFAARPITITVSAPPELAECNLNVGGAVMVAENTPSAIAGRPVSGMRLSLGIVLVAFLGGLILNLMPCVLPVLALKLSAVMDAAGAHRHELRLRFLAGAAGIITSFMLLATGLALVRLAGGTVGWGIQFQNPVFLLVMIVFLGIFALSLLDRVILPVPAFAQSLGAAINGPGGRATPGYKSDFLTGMLATILATPCSAPFVGTAVAAALSGGMVDLFGIFLALGLGLAAPWLLVAAFPAMVSFLPRPGSWMIWMRRVLALLLFGTMIWLAAVLAVVIGPGPQNEIGALNQSSVQDDGGIWSPWNSTEMNRLLADGTPVLVDVTADWCVTCKANKALVLDRAPVAPALAAASRDGKLHLRRADWTRPDPEIAQFLAAYGRFGIPFNVLITPSRDGSIILPELLTSSAIISALEKAGVAVQ